MRRRGGAVMAEWRAVWFPCLWAVLLVGAGRLPQWAGDVLAPTDGASPVPLDCQDAECTCSEVRGKYVKADCDCSCSENKLLVGLSSS
jgi:hypothetical protein